MVFHLLIKLDFKKSKYMYEGIYNTVLVKGIEERINRKNYEVNAKSVTDVALLKSISKYLSSVKMSVKCL